MPFKPNYRFERAERDRAKKAKKEERLRRRQERATPSPDETLLDQIEEKERIAP
jgi:hypothetical protein